MPPRALVRTDASLRIGSGHVMRCLCLARAMSEQGVEVHFACRDLNGNLNDLIGEWGFPLHRLPPPAPDFSPPAEPPYSAWLEVDDMEDAAECRTVAESLGGADILIVDHYALDARWEQAMRPLTGRILVIDDLADRRHDADIFLDPNRGGDPDKPGDLLPPACARLLGPHYAPLRPEFAAARSILRKRDGTVNRLFVFLGGVDAGGFTLRVLDALDLLGTPVPATDVVVGAANRQAAAIAERCRKNQHLEYHQSVTGMAGLMAAADLAVGAAGATMWERACVGLPSLVVTVADNQRPGAVAAAAAGIAVTLEGDEAGPETLAARIGSLTPGQLRDMGERCLALVDGRGTERVLRVLLPPAVVLRRAGPSDRDAILTWRNDPGVRRYSRCSAVISQEQHERWFEEMLADPERVLFIAECDDRPVGVLRYDCEGADARVSIYVVPGCSGHGYGAAILRAGSEWLRRHRADTTRVLAEIDPDNLASLRAFSEAGYLRDDGIHIQELKT